MRCIRVLILLSVAALLAQCGNKDENLPPAEHFAWDKESVSFFTSAYGASGPAPTEIFEDSNDISCQQDTYSFRFVGGVLTKSSCENQFEGTKDQNITLNDEQLEQLDDIFADVVYIPKIHDGGDCPLYSLPVNNRTTPPLGQAMLQVFQDDGSTKILDLSSNSACGEKRPQYIHGTLMDFNFMDALDSFFDDPIPES